MSTIGAIPYSSFFFLSSHPVIIIMLWTAWVAAQSERVWRGVGRGAAVDGCAIFVDGRLIRLAPTEPLSTVAQAIHHATAGVSTDRWEPAGCQSA
jgi:hypothetical protein